jgi:hypothetical protein
MGGDRRPSELSRGTPWRLAGTAARFSGALLAGGAIGAVAFWLLLATLLALVFSPVAGLGLPFLAVMIWLVRLLAWLERRRVRWVTGTPVAEAYRPLHGSLLARVRILLADAGTWRDLAWLAVQSVAGGLGLMFLLVLGIGLMGMAMPLIWALQPSGVVFNFGWPVWSMLRAVATVPPSAALVVVSWWACSRMSLGSARLSG